MTIKFIHTEISQKQNRDYDRIHGERKKNINFNGN